MGTVLSKEELHLLQPHLVGFNPSSLATVIWDAIQEVCQDDKEEGFGIHFSSSLNSQGCDGENPMVTFWDEMGIDQLPRKVFLELLQFIGEHTMNNLSTDTCNNDIHRLEMALAQLKVKLSLLVNEDGSVKYRERMDSGIDITSCTNNFSGSAELLDKIRSKNGSCGWINSVEDDVFSPQPLSNIASQRRNSAVVGMEAVVERLPELRTRYKKSLSADNEGSGFQERVFSKLRVLSALKPSARGGDGPKTGGHMQVATPSISISSTESGRSSLA